jgi:hypothetical protein
LASAVPSKELIARASRVGVRIDEGEDALLLIIAHEEDPGEREGCRGEGAQQGDPPRRNAGEEECAEERCGEDERRSHVGLQCHKNERRKDHQRRDENVAAPTPLAVALAQHGGKRNDAKDLRQLA